MRLACYLSALSCGLTLAAWWTGASAPGWPGAALAATEGGAAACCCALAALYWLRGMGRSVEAWLAGPGGSARVVQLVLWPYRALAWGMLLVASRLGRSRRVDEVAPGLYVGGRPFSWERGRLAALGIDAVLDLCAELPSRLDRGRRPILTERCPILDGTAPTPDQFRRAEEWVAGRRAEGRAVLIHCAQGQGRSAIVAAVVLCRIGRAVNLTDALRQIGAARLGARPSSRQRRAAAEFLGRPSTGSEAS